jgi:hypothetical protein
VTQSDTFSNQAESEEERAFYDEEAGIVAERWIDDRDSIPPAEVCVYRDVVELD